MEVLVGEREAVGAGRGARPRPHGASARGEHRAGKPAIGLLEPRRHFYEREARAFAAELLMPFAEVRRRWFGLSRDGVSVEDMVRRLSDEFAVTTSAMRVRLQQMKVVRA